MSRCYPYPPPGYLLNTANNEALFESIKLQREREIAKAERKKEKNEKKEKRREKKSKESSKSGFDKATYESKGKYVFKCFEDEEKRKLKESSKYGFDKAALESKGKYMFKCLEDETEQLERSNLTEEHGPAVCSQNSSCSSDSTQNSNKRKRSASPSQAGIHAHGSIIRIRLSKKGGQREASTSIEKLLPKPPQQVAEVAVRTVADRAANPLLRTNNQGCPSISVPEPSPSTSGRTDGLATVDKAAVASCSKVYENDIECQYKNLMEMLPPPSLPSEHLDFDDQSWLFQRKPKHGRVEEKNAVINETTCASFSLWPRAQYIPEAELYALPFTVPF